MNRSQIVRDCMSMPPITIDAGMRIPAAIAIMKQHNVRRLPVLAADGRLVGIVTRVDLNEVRPDGYDRMTSWTSIQYAINMMTIGEVMTRNPVTCDANTSLCDAVKLMLRHRISGLPVTMDDDVIGVLTDSDIFRAFVVECGRPAAPGLAQAELSGDQDANFNAH